MSSENEIVVISTASEGGEVDVGKDNVSTEEVAMEELKLMSEGGPTSTSSVIITTALNTTATNCSSSTSAAEPEPPTAPTPKFSDGEIVLVLLSPVLYEARVLSQRFEEKENQFAYFVHYMGWNKGSDEWVLEHLILKKREDTMAIKEGLRPKKSKSKKKNGEESTVESNAGVTASLSSTQSKFPFVETESCFQTKMEIKIPIPEELCLLVTKDAHQINGRKKKVAILPARRSIQQIFDKFLERKDQEKDELEFEMCHALKAWFKSLCRSDLLYNRFEREQYDKICAEIKQQKKSGRGAMMQIELADYYGAAHLMRLFTKLGSRLALTDMSPEMVENFHKTSDKFFKFMIENYQELVFERDYEDA